MISKKEYLNEMGIDVWQSKDKLIDANSKNNCLLGRAPDTTDNGYQSAVDALTGLSLE